MAGQVQDETESLIPLLETILAAHPSANALCAGAILSTYQRTRIENVARRLGLIPLSYLWQYPSLPSPTSSPATLLQDMASVGMEARIVKVASGGLDERFLWEDLLGAREQRMMGRAVGRFGGSVLGEGGEYETLVLDGPAGVWKEKIVVEEGERVVRRMGGGEAWIDILGGSVLQKGEMGFEEEADWRDRLRIPGLWDARFEELKEDRAVMGEFMQKDYVDFSDGIRRRDWTISRSVVQGKSNLNISNISSIIAEKGIEHQISSIITTITTILRSNHRSPDDIIFTTILLRTMSDFPEMNAIYGTLFSNPNPPARVTVACGDTLPQGVDVLLSIVVDLGPHQNRKGLHVQSRSYWAPANIGPYSQAIAMNVSRSYSESSLVFVAGQIPLVPASMEVLSAESDQGRDGMGLFHQQAVLALQHLWRIGVEMKVSWWTGAVAFIVGDHDAYEKAVSAWTVWKKIHERPKMEAPVEEDSFDGPDAWDKKYGEHRENFLVDEPPEHHLPDFQSVAFNGESHDLLVPGFFAVQIDEIPRACDIEWQCLGISHSRVKVQPCVMDELEGIQVGVGNGSIMVVYYGISILVSDEDCHRQVLKILHSQRAIPSSGDVVGVQATVHATIYTHQPVLFEDIHAQIVPCRRVWGPEGSELVAGLVIQSEVLFEG